MLIVYAPQIMTILYSEKYIPGINVFRVYSAVLLLRVTYFGMILNASGRTKFILYSSVITLLVNIVLDILSIFIAQMVQVIMTSRLIRIPFGEVFPWKRLLLHSGINIVWGSIVFMDLRTLNVGVTGKEIFYCILSGVPVVSIYFLIERRCALRLWKKLNAND